MIKVNLTEKDNYQNAHKNDRCHMLSRSKYKEARHGDTDYWITPAVLGVGRQRQTDHVF